MKHVGYGCEGLVLGPDAKPRVRGATDVTCNANSMSLTVRTQRPMHGLMYAQNYHNTPACVLASDGSSRELTITFRDGECGLYKTPSQVSFIVIHDGKFSNLFKLIATALIEKLNRNISRRCGYT
ncbi:unnamed protein product [Cylicostephanus goldi]|uniref:ZP domain-containing protein n=1 Tax=Cylicostephanus goldi TaxID=71465 RepID=A0A3P6RHI7_CYLGO|nr:unnamed protein product [Cylicostephanus goldi]